MSGGLTSTGEAGGQRLSMKIGIVNASSRFSKARDESGALLRAPKFAH